MQANFVPYSETGFFSPLILDYIDGEDRVKEYYNLPPKIESFKTAIENRSSFITNRTVLHQALLNQHAGVAINDETVANIELLKESNTYTITTGHQLCLFTGPLYFLFKIISMLNMTKQLNSTYPEFNFVPVFWMASEDHDFEEISSINVFQEKITWNQDKEGAVGKLQVDSMATALAQLKLVVGDEKEILSLIESAYKEGTTLTEATRKLVYSLFPNDGLVIIDGDDADLKSLFKDVMKDELQNERIKDAVNKTNESFTGNYKVQVNPRNINLFLLADGSRTRIESADDELLQELDEHPEKFSPNVIMRCMYQETILPNLSYIGGGGEIAYWLQLKTAFELYNIPFPVLMLRNSVLHIDTKSNKRFNELGFNTTQLFLGIDELVKEFIGRNAEGNHDLDEEMSKINAVFDDLENKAAVIDPTLKDSIKGERKKMQNSLESVSKRMYKAEKRKSEVHINKISSVKEKLFPGGSLQERYDNLIPYHMKYGADFITNLKDHIDPFDLRFLILSE
ncbi:MAG: bacillithiol biosynthesis cysteine-adding enzyme BshC [Flavobacteriales bacterium]|nr:bacillithiol biosynthesis cysteine-adding enzyme BshC [Flavobacteriales bacterium]